MTCWLCGFQAKEPVCKSNPCQICIEVNQVNKEVDQAVATLRHLIAKRCDLRSEQNRVHGTLINRLPVELKNRIFEHLLPSRDEWGKITRTKKTTKSSFLASISVCREWRNIALLNPFLWSTMHIKLGTSNSSSPIINWILRSKTLPVTFHIHLRRRGIKGSTNVLADALSQCSNRLHSLSLDVPDYTFKALQDNAFQYHRLTRLRIKSSLQSQGLLDQPRLLLNPTASPRKIVLGGVSFQSLQISWHRLSSATVDYIGLEDVTRLFRYASQMTYCQISLRRGPDNFSMPPIIHHKLKTLNLRRTKGDMAHFPLRSLTLPCLQEFSTDDMFLLTQLPDLVRQSSCPLTMLTLFHYFDDELPFDRLQPLFGVTDLFVGALDEEPDLIETLLLEGYFPDLRHLTLRLQPFEVLWDFHIIPLLLDRKRAQPYEPNEGRFREFLVVDPDRAPKFDRMWNSDVGEQLKALNISQREDGFEFL